MSVRGIRGATTVESNQAGEILAATRELLEAILAANPSLQVSEIAAAWFTLTQDLDAAYPAQAARELGWILVPTLCSCEVNVPGSLSRCIRVLLQWNTDLSPQEIHHVYLREAVSLRPDLIGKENK